MKAKKIITTITITTILIAGLFSYSYAMHGKKEYHGGKGYHHGMGYNGGHGNMGFYNNMTCFGNFTDKEREHIADEIKKIKNETRELRKELFNKRMALEEQICSDSPDTKKIKSLREDLDVLRDALKMKRIKFMKKMYKAHPEMHKNGKYHQENYKHDGDL
ncbi:MAG: hypothetical protein CSB21_01825 [Deltaproteobacteria bacterium]|nr:MAG: hypothetical protein CSB21_01825 [Deltaproteobacteria bacterium]